MISFNYYIVATPSTIYLKNNNYSLILSLVMALSYI